MWEQDIIAKQEEELTEFEKHKIIIPAEHCLSEPFKLIISAGSLRVYYGAGVCHMMHKLSLNNNITCIRGTSAGALAAVSLACNMSLKQWLASYHILAKKHNKQSLVKTTLEYDYNIIPENAHILANEKRVEIVATEITWFGLKEKTFDHFPTRKYLIYCLAASCCIPILTYTTFPYCIEIDGKYYIDGSFCTKTPIEYNKHINQFVIILHKVNYPFQFMFTPTDVNIHKFIMSGSLDVISFIQNSINTKVFMFIKNPVQKTFINNYIILNLIWIAFELLCELLY